MIDKGVDNANDDNVRTTSWKNGPRDTGPKVSEEHSCEMLQDFLTLCGSDAEAVVTATVTETNITKTLTAARKELSSTMAPMLLDRMIKF